MKFTTFLLGVLASTAISTDTTTNPSEEELIRISVFAQRKANVSEDAFQSYWANNHSVTVRDWAVRNNFVKYIQYHTPTSYRNLGQAMYNATGRQPLTWDGIGDFFVRNYSDFESAFLDPYYTEHIEPDEASFIDMDNIGVTIGVEYVVIDNGEIVTSHKSHF